MKFGHKKLYIGGELVDAREATTREVICPGTGQAVATVAWAGQADAERALEAAQTGFKQWVKMSIRARNQWIDKLRTALQDREAELREAVMYEMGKTYHQAGEDYESLINALEWYPQEMLHRRDEVIPDPDGTHAHRVVSEPAGVAVAYLAWNFPLLNLSFKLGPALAAGCALIVKPSEKSPLSAYVVGEVLAGINFPAGVVNILAGSNETVAPTLSGSPIPRVITMIGSSASGRAAMQQAATSIKHFSMELGGNAPAIVSDDADLSRALSDLSALKFGNCGQVCVAPNRIFVQRSIYREFVDRFTEKASQQVVGFGRDNHVDLGPLVDERAQQRMKQLVQTTQDEGATLECGGKIPEDRKEGFFFEPTVFSDVRPEMTIFREEIFGPLASIIPYDDDAQVLAMANDSSVGLSSYVYSNGIDRVNYLSAGLEVGEVHVNGFKYAIYLPHGGVKESGLGHDCSHLALNDYLTKKRITTKINQP